MQPPRMLAQMTKNRFGVDGFAGADEGFPPAAFAGDGVLAGDVLIAGQSMADQDGVRFVGVQLAVGFVGDREWGDVAAAVQAEGFAGREADDETLGIGDLTQRGIRRCCLAE